MSQKSVNWYYADSIEKAFDYISQPNTYLYAGGLSATKKLTHRAEGFVVLNNGILNEIKVDNDMISIGAFTTINSFVESCLDNSTCVYLKNAIKEAGSMSIRERMTFGGSIHDFPIWSDVVGPLITLNATIEYFDGNHYSYIPVEEYIGKVGSFQPHIITTISFPVSQSSKYFNYRLTRVHFEYPSMTINGYVKIEDNTISDIKVFIGGTTKKYSKMYDFEQYLKKKKLTADNIFSARKFINPVFSGNSMYSGNYLTEQASIALVDLLMNILEEQNARNI